MARLAGMQHTRQLPPFTGIAPNAPQQQQPHISAASSTARTRVAQLLLGRRIARHLWQVRKSEAMAVCPRLESLARLGRRRRCRAGQGGNKAS